MKPRPPDYQKERGDRQIARVIEALTESPMTTTQLQAKLSLSRAAIGVYLRRLRADPRRVRIAGYAPAPRIDGGGVKPPIFELGSAKDARKPKPLTEAQKFKLLKADEDRHERHLAKRRAYSRIITARKKPNTWASALGVQA